MMHITLVSLFFLVIPVSVFSLFALAFWLISTSVINEVCSHIGTCKGSRKIKSLTPLTLKLIGTQAMKKISLNEKVSVFCHSN